MYLCSCARSWLWHLGPSPTGPASPKHRGPPSEPGSRRPPAGPCPGTSSHPRARRRHALLQAIQALQKGTRLLLRKTPFCRLEIRVKFTHGVDFSWQTQALLALQETAEAFPVRLFGGCLSLLLTRRPHHTLLKGCSAGPEDQRHSTRAQLGSGHPPMSLVDTRAPAHG
uniref:Uncharacterized protein n=1 Tax=Ovis aries TaxID=9940 RepID=A0AC11ASJ7_SHEEP